MNPRSRTAPPQRLRRRVMPRLGRPDEIVVGDIERRQQIAKLLRHLVGKRVSLSPAFWAARSTFWPCSSVPVRKNTSSPIRR